jgi:hypothetical protein
MNVLRFPFLRVVDAPADEIRHDGPLADRQWQRDLPIE